MSKAFFSLSIGVFLLLVSGAVPADGTPLATTSWDVVPIGAPLPSGPRMTMASSCDIADTCALVCPDESSVMIADMAYDPVGDRFAVVDVANIGGISWMDAQTCEMSSRRINPNVSQRGCAYDSTTGLVYTGGWNDDTVWIIDSDFAFIDTCVVLEDIAGLAIDEEARILYASTNSYIDRLVEFSIEASGRVAKTGRRWVIPWQEETDGFTAASLEYDDASGIFMLINQDAGALESFRFEGDELVPWESCPLSVSQGWGLGLDFSRVDLRVAEIVSRRCDFPIVRAAPPNGIYGSGDVPDFEVQWEPLLEAGVAGFNIPVGLVVRNYVGVDYPRYAWVEIDSSEGMMRFGRHRWVPGHNRLRSYDGIDFPEGVYSGIVYLGESYGAETPDASGPVSFEITGWGIQEPAAKRTVTVVPDGQSLQTHSTRATMKVEGEMIAQGPDAVVPEGAPLPRAWLEMQAQGGEAGSASVDACDLLSSCGSICPNPESVFLADFAYDTVGERFFGVDVVRPDGLFVYNNRGCETHIEVSFAGVSQRGCAVDNLRRHIYVGGWNDQTIWMLDKDLNVISSTYVGLAIAGLAVDEVESRLYVAVNAFEDAIHEYEIGPNGEISETGREWTIPWQNFNSSHAAASLEYDDASGLLFLVNQDAAALEYFRIENDILRPYSQCPLPVGLAWGMGLDFSTAEVIVPDNDAFGCDFPLHRVAPDPDVIGGVEFPDWTVRYRPLATTLVGSGGGPIGIWVHNGTGAVARKVVWLGVDIAPAAKLRLGTFDFAPGTSRVNLGLLPVGVELDPGDYTGRLNIATSINHPIDASVEIEIPVEAFGLQ